jgi:hypothetical protein
VKANAHRYHNRAEPFPLGSVHLIVASIHSYAPIPKLGLPFPLIARLVVRCFYHHCFKATQALSLGPLEIFEMPLTVTAYPDESDVNRLGFG